MEAGPKHEKQIVCLANSRKLSGHCVAGREDVSSGESPWIRPVSSRPTEELNPSERCYEGGAEPELMDVVKLGLQDPRPHEFQTENWLLDDRFYWEKVGTVSWERLDELVEPEAPLWIDGQSTRHGLNDCISLLPRPRLTTSLRLIRVPRLQIHVLTDDGKPGQLKRRVQARFKYAKNDYWLWVTDPLVERDYLRQADGEYGLGESCVTVSLGEPFQDRTFKLVAAVINRP